MNTKKMELNWLFNPAPEVPLSCRP